MVIRLLRIFTTPMSSKVEATTFSIPCCSRTESVISVLAMQMRPNRRSMDEIVRFFVKMSPCSPMIE